MPVPKGYSLTPPKKPQPIRSTTIPTPPNGYSLQSQQPPTAFTKAVNDSLGHALSADIEDRRDPTFTEKIRETFDQGKMRVGQTWDEFKREAQGNFTGDSVIPPSALPKK